MADLIDKNLLMEELHSMLEGDADLRKDYEYMGIDDCIRSMPTTTEAEIRSKAIEEFAEALKNKTENYEFTNFLESSWSHTWATLHLKSCVDETAKELKGA